MDVLENHRSGRTYRGLLHAINWASANPGKQALFAVHSQPMAEYVMHMARAILQPTKAVLRWTTRQIMLENGATIQVRVVENGLQYRIRGMQYVLFEDHAVEEILQSDLERAILAEIRAWAIAPETKQ